MELYEKKWTQDARDKHPKQDFADPENRKFPIADQSDVNDAWRLAGHAANPDAVRARIKSIAKRLGLTAGLPDTAKATKKEGEDEECDGCEGYDQSPIVDQHSDVEITNQGSQDNGTPGTTIATIKTCWLEDDAISLNGRQYPKESVDKLVQGAQIALTAIDSLPLTCYVSHDQADKDNTLDIAGKITQVWKEGSKAYALIDIPNTRTGRDVATLVQGGYIRSQSLRATGAEIVADRQHTFPQVTGQLKLLGIDFTTSPGLSQIARIKDIQMMSESEDISNLQEIFSSNLSTVQLQENKDLLYLQKVESDNTMKIKEEDLKPLVSGVTDGMTGENPRDDYSDKMYKMTPDADSSTFPHQLSDVHDRLSYVLGLDCGPSTMEAVKRFGDEIVTEKGAALSAKTKKHIAIAHDKVAEAMNLNCSSKDSDNSKNDSNNKDDNDGDEGGDKPGYSNESEKPSKWVEDFIETIKQISKDAIKEDKSEDKSTPIIEKIEQIEKKEEIKNMTPEEAKALLEKAGYSVVSPKSSDEILQEKIDVKLAEQAKIFEAQQTILIEKIEQMGNAFEAKVNPFKVQRKSLVEGATVTPEKKPYYRPGDYVRESLNKEGFREQLLDRSRPMPEGISPERLLKELEVELLGAYDARYGLTD